MHIHTILIFWDFALFDTEIHGDGTRKFSTQTAAQQYEVILKTTCSPFLEFSVIVTINRQKHVTGAYVCMLIHQTLSLIVLRMRVLELETVKKHPKSGRNRRRFAVHRYLSLFLP